MRAYVPDYELRVARNLKEALHTLRSEPQVWKPFAGGTDLMVLYEAGKLPAGKYLSIAELNELKVHELTTETISLGALTTFTEIRKNPVLQKEFPLLCSAAAETGALAIQNRGTLGGNIVNASPAADSPPALLVYEADLALCSEGGTRWIPYSKFHLGYKKMDLRPDELLSAIRLKRQTHNWNQRYHKVGTRQAQSISKVCMAAASKLGTQKTFEVIRIAFGSVAPTPLRCTRTEGALQGKSLNPALIQFALTELKMEISPIDDIRSTKHYRQQVACNLLQDYLESL